MIENPDFEQIRLISLKRMSWFKLTGGNENFTLKSQYSGNVSTVIWIVLFTLKALEFFRTGEDLIMFCLFGITLILISAKIIFGKANHNKIDIHLLNRKLKISSLNILGNLVKKKILVDFNQIEKVSCEKKKKHGFLYVHIDGNKHFLLMIRIREKKNEEVIDSLNDDLDKIVESLENIFKENQTTNIIFQTN